VFLVRRVHISCTLYPDVGLCFLGEREKWRKEAGLEVTVQNFILYLVYYTLLHLSASLNIE
jgi:hypothetical protein